AYTSAGVLGTYTWGTTGLVAGQSNPSYFLYQPANTQGLGTFGGVNTLVADPVFAIFRDSQRNTTKYQMDNDARPRRIVAADPGITTYTYNTSAFLTSETNPLNYTTTFTLDSAEYGVCPVKSVLDGRGLMPSERRAFLCPEVNRAIRAKSNSGVA